MQFRLRSDRRKIPHTRKGRYSDEPRGDFPYGRLGQEKQGSVPRHRNGVPERSFSEKPDFPRAVRKIKALIEYKDQTVIGFSHKNDTVFLDNACKRYNLPSIDYDFVDVQTIHKDYNNLINPFSTEKLVEELNLDVNKYVPHKSDDDAEVSMLVTKNFAKAGAVA